jgi:hypothetical protein
MGYNNNFRVWTCFTSEFGRVLVPSLDISRTPEPGSNPFESSEI